jgi:hypothetical protein
LSSSTTKGGTLKVVVPLGRGEKWEGKKWKEEFNKIKGFEKLTLNRQPAQLQEELDSSEERQSQTTEMGTPVRHATEFGP